jgi:hypothetical protein
MQPVDENMTTIPTGNEDAGAGIESLDDIETEMAANLTKYQTDAKYRREIQAKIDALNSEVVRLREEKVNAVKEVENTYKSQINDILLNNHFANYNYSAPVSKEVNVKIARQLIAEEMTKRGYQLNPENGEFKLSSSEGLEVFENNQKVGFKDFSERLLAQHKLLAVNTPQEPNTPNAQGQPVTMQTQGSQGNRNGKLLSKYDQLIEEANNDLK